ncbi:MAG: hypothetical protein ABSE43_13150 [Steroidobacteraceae bacterium]|jgi:hypothetical protein
MLSWLLSWTRFRGPRRELYFTLASVLIGFALMPVLIWSAGHLVLGAYANGSLWAMLVDFYRGLAERSLPFWVVALGPLLLLWALRGCNWLRTH